MGDAELRRKLVQSRASGKPLWATKATATRKPEPRRSGARALSSIGPQPLSGQCRQHRGC